MHYCPGLSCNRVPQLCLSGPICSLTLLEARFLLVPLLSLLQKAGGNGVFIDSAETY